jgi:hypothetical protein
MIIALADNSLGKTDRLRLESFATHLVAHGLATRWHWQRKRGLDMTLHVYKGSGEEPMFFLNRSRANRAFFAKDAAGRIIAQGALPHVLAIADRFARGYGRQFHA